MHLVSYFNTSTCTFPHLLWWTIPFANYTIRISIELVVKIITKCVNAVQTNCWISLIWWLKSNTSKQTRACTHINLLIHASNYYCVTHLAVLIFKIIFCLEIIIYQADTFRETQRTTEANSLACSGPPNRCMTFADCRLAPL